MASTLRELSRPAPALQLGPFRAVLAAGLALTLIAVIARFAWTGFIESDDVFYTHAARGWAEHFPYLGTTHWGLRHTIVLPIALCFVLFGQNEVTLILPFLVYACAFLTIIFFWTRSISSSRDGLFAALLVAATPVFAGWATIAVDDIPEACFILASVWVFHSAVRRSASHGERLPIDAPPASRLGPPPTWRLLLAGGLAGLAFITRETTAALLIYYGVLFLIGYGGRRLDYVWMGVGFACIYLIDAGLLYAASGDPFYRFDVSLTGVGHDNPSMDKTEATALYNRHGVLNLPRWIQAPSAILANQKFGLFFWAAIPAAFALAVTPDRSHQRDTVRLLSGLALTWFLVTSYAMYFLWIIPRYQTVTMGALAIPLAIALGRVIVRGHQRAAYAVLAVMLGTGSLLTVMGDTNPLFGERALARFAALEQRDSQDRHGESRRIVTDTDTLHSAGLLLDWNGGGSLVSDGQPAPGDLFFWNEHPRRDPPPGRIRPAAGWKLLARFEAPRNPIAVFFRSSGLISFLPASIATKLDAPPRIAEVYQIPQSAIPGSQTPGLSR